MVNVVLLFAPLVATIAVSLGLALYGWTRSSLRARTLFVVLTLQLAFLAAFACMELYVPDLPGKVLCNNIEYLAVATMPPVFLLFTLNFLGRKPATALSTVLLFAVPAMTLLLLWSNDYHHLFYTQISLDTASRYSTLIPDYNIGFAVHTAYSLLLLVTGVAMLAVSFLQSSRMHRKQVRLVLVAAFIPLFCLLLGLSRAFPVSLTYFMVIGFLAAGVLIFLGTFMYELFDVVPLALSNIIDTVDDGVIVVDTAGHVLFANQNVMRRMGCQDRDVYARPVEAISPGLSRGSVERARRGDLVEVKLGREPNERVFQLGVDDIVDSGGTTTSVLLTLRDITEEKQIAEALREANVKLNLLSSITRHDTLNQVTVIQGYAEIMMERTLEEGDQRKYGERIVAAVKFIEKQFLFAKSYQSLGVNAPAWHSASAIFERAFALGLAEGLEAELYLNDLEIFADPLVDRVFSILLDNTKRHGERATRVKVWHVVAGEILTIVYEDDGVGIHPKEKERIFEQGFGRDSGLGLFLARQVLEVTGMTVRETGELGQGARFEMAVPNGKWRLASAPAPPQEVRLVGH